MNGLVTHIRVVCVPSNWVLIIQTKRRSAKKWNRITNKRALLLVRVDALLINQGLIFTYYVVCPLYWSIVLRQKLQCDAEHMRKYLILQSILTKQHLIFHIIRPKRFLVTHTYSLVFCTRCTEDLLTTVSHLNAVTDRDPPRFLNGIV